MVKNGMADRAMREKQCVVLWSADSNDWKHTTSSSIARRILRQASPGGIALMHDGGGNRAATVAALPLIINGLRERGYRFVTVPELLEMRCVEAKKPVTTAQSRHSARHRKIVQATPSASRLSKR
jgi:chitin deacetylase